METKERAAKLILLIGYNGTGKSTVLRKLIINELKKPDGRALIVTPDDIEFPTIEFVHPNWPERIKSYKGVRKIVYFPGLLDIIKDNFRGGLLAFDDCRAYLGAGTEMELHNLLIRRRQKSIDIVAVGHGFTEIPPKFFTFASEIVLFKTADKIDRRKNVIKDFEYMKQQQAEVNREALKNPYHYVILKQ